MQTNIKCYFKCNTATTHTNHTVSNKFKTEQLILRLYRLEYIMLQNLLIICFLEFPQFSADCAHFMLSRYALYCQFI